jgi:protein SCO1/2
MSLLRAYLISGFLCGFFACSTNEVAPTLPYYNTPDFEPQFFESIQAASTKITHQLKSFSFLDQHGQFISDTLLRGKVHVANFFFSRCTNICPNMIKQMRAIESEFGQNTGVEMLSFSVTPWLDSVSVLKKYAQKNNIKSKQWHLLTGDKNAIYTLARKSYFAEENLGFTKDNSQFLHTEHVVLVDRTLRIRGIYNGSLGLEMEQLAKDIKLLLAEK